MARIGGADGSLHELDSPPENRGTHAVGTFAVRNDTSDHHRVGFLKSSNRIECGGRDREAQRPAEEALEYGARVAEQRRDVEAQEQQHPRQER